MKLCYNSENDIFIHADGTISKCCLAWSIKKIPTLNNKIPVYQCENVCNTTCDNITSINILLSYSCLDKCRCCEQHSVFTNLREMTNKIGTVDVDKIIKTIDFVIEHNKNINSIQVGSYFDSSSDIELLSNLINKISEKYNLELKVYHMGLTSLNQLSSKLSKKSISQSTFIINFNGIKNIHNLYKPYTFDIIKNNITTNSELKLEINCLIFSESLQYLDDIYSSLCDISEYVQSVEIKLDNSIARLKKEIITEALIKMKLIYYKNKNCIPNIKINDAIKNFINYGYKKSKFSIELFEQLKHLECDRN